MRIAGRPADNVKIEIKCTLPELPEKEMMMEAAARGLANLIRDHLFERNEASKARPGWPKSNYYADAAQSVSSTVAEGGAAVVSISKEGMALHYYGGIVKPKKAKALAIPLRPEVAGIWPSEYAGIGKVLFKIKKTGGKAVLAARDENTGKGFRVLWLLMKSVEVKGDEKILPKRSEMLNKAGLIIRMLFA